MSVYKLIPSHYIKLHHEVRPATTPPPPAPCTSEQFENLKLLLRTSNTKLTSLAQTVRELRGQLQQRDETIAALTAPRPYNKCSVEVHSEHGRAQPQDVVVDVTPDIQVRLKVELVEQGRAPPLIKVASTVVTRRPATPPQPPSPASKRPEVADDDVRARSAAPGPVRKHYQSGAVGGHLAASPLYSSLMWRTRQRAKELGYRFVWSRYGKILVKKDVQSPPVYILDEADLRKMA